MLCPSYAKIYQTTENTLMNDAITQNKHDKGLYIRLTKDSFILLSQAILEPKTMEESNAIVRNMNEKYANELKATIVFGISNLY